MEERFDVITNRTSKTNTNKLFLLCLILPLLLCSCGIRIFERHRPAVLHWATFVFEGSNNKRYFYLGYSSDRHHFCEYDASYFNKNHYLYRSLYQEDADKNPIYYESISSNSSCLFASLWKPVGNERSIAIYDKSFSQIFSLNVDSFIGDIESTENYLYYTKKEKDAESYSLYRLDLESHEISKLAENIYDKTSYIDNDVHLFFNPGNDITKYSEKTPLFTNWDKKIYYSDKLEIHSLKNAIQVLSNAEKYVFKNNYGLLDLYPKAYLINDKVLFAGMRYQRDKKCLSNCLTYNGSTNGYCICGIKESYLFSFDTVTHQLELIKEYKPGTFLIDFDLENVEYYYNGGLYVNDALHKNCETIKVSDLEKFDFWEADGYRDDRDIYCRYGLSYYNGEFYGVLDAD